MPHIHSENTHRLGRQKKFMIAAASFFLFLVCALAFSLPDESGKADLINQRNLRATAQQVEITISGYVKNQFDTGVGGATATLTGSFRKLQLQMRVAATAVPCSAECILDVLINSVWR